MNSLTQVPIRQVALGFSAGALFMALVSLVATALAQTPTPASPDMQQMLEWCRQMMGSVDIQAMLETCRAMMGQAGAMMQGMMGGMCMMGRQAPSGQRSPEATTSLSSGLFVPTDRTDPYAVG